MKREEKILEKALEMFNEKGIEYVGIRELAAALGMRASNITYYFPTKDDLVNRLSIDLNKLNSQVVVEDENLSLDAFLGKFQLAFQNQLKYRCLPLSFVHLMERNKKIAERYKLTQSDRNATLKSNIRTLAEKGELKFRDNEEIETLVSTIGMIARFWISEAVVSNRDQTPEEQIDHYVTLIGNLLKPYTVSVS